MDEKNLSIAYPLPCDIKKPFVDWLSFSIPYKPENFNWIVKKFGNRTERKKGFNSYTNSFSTDLGALTGYSPAMKENKIHVVLSGKCLSSLRGKIQIHELISEIISIEGVFRRIDLALDDFDGLLDFSVIWDKLENKHVSSRFKNYGWIESKSKNPDDYSKIITGNLYSEGKAKRQYGNTIYIGSRKSETFCRIYDKIKEAKTNKIEYDGKTYHVNNWNRLEFELKGESADQYCNPHDYINIETGELTASKKSTKCIKGKFTDRDFSRTAFYYLKFLDPKYKKDGSETNKRHWTVSDFWIDFLKQSEGESIGLSYIRPGLEGVRDWTLNQTSGAFFTLYNIFGEEYLEYMLSRGADLYSENERYQKLTREFLSRDQGNVSSIDKRKFFTNYFEEINKIHG